MRTLALSILALTGCMRIYPDPELPDIEVQWYSGSSCETGDEIQLILVGLDDGSISRYATPCGDDMLKLEDVDRKLFRVDGALVKTDGSIYSTSSSEADLRNGFNEEAYLSFDDAYIRVAWDFDMGATCASLELDTIALDFGFPDQGYAGYVYTIETSCELGVYAGYFFGQMSSLQLRGISRRKTVAASPVLMIEAGERQEPSDLGTLTLTPCGTDCPSAPSNPDF